MNEYQIKHIKTYIFGVHSIILLLLLMLLFISATSAQIVNTRLETIQPKQYEKTEWDIQLKTTFDNPYWESDVALDMKIETPSGKTLSLPCFYVDGESAKISNWKARFTPRESGSYTAYFILSQHGKAISASEKTNFSVNTSSGKGFLQPNNSWTFKFDNGEVFRGIGENICWEARSNDDSKYFKALHEETKYNFDYMLTQLANNGGNYFRVWMCSWSLPLEFKHVSNTTNRYQNSDEYFNPGAIKRMEELVNLCDSLGVYMMLCIDQNGNYRGGMEQSNYHINQGGFATNAKELFTLPKAQEQYKNRLRYLIARWGYSPSIGAWEFFNEIDYLAYGRNDSVMNDMHQAITDWHDVMSTYLKENDPYQHLITTSVSHRDVKGLNELKNIDFNQKHIYKNTEAIPSVITDYEQKYHKPYVIGEFGYEWDWSKNFNDFSSEMDSDYKRGLWLGLFNPTPILPMSWWWEFFEDRGLMAYFKSVREIYESMIEAGNGEFSEVSVQPENKQLETYAVKCGNKIYTYIFNKGEKINQFNIQFSNIKLNENKTEVFNCETGQYNQLDGLKMSGNRLSSNAIELGNQQDIIIILYLNQQK